MDDKRRAALQRLRWFPLGVAVLVIGFHWVRLIPHARNDFKNHYEGGRRLVLGRFIYENDVNRVYPPFWALVHAPLTVFSPRVAMLIVFPLGAASMIGLVVILKKLADRHWPLDGDALFWSIAAAVASAYPFLDRDLAEAGVNSLLVMLSWLGIYLWTRRREWLGGTCVGLAAAMKCTPVIFVGYFLWKRQWKMALASTVAMVIFSISPMNVMGPQQWLKASRYWADGVKQGLSDPDPSRGVLGEEKAENLSLRPALARYLMNLPYGHMGRPETSDSADRPNAPPDPLYLQFFDLSPGVAGLIVRGMMVAGAVGILWMFRRPIVDRGTVDVLWECAALSLVILLYSPVTWKQHCVGVLPALFFMIRARFAGDRVPRMVIAMILGYVFLVVVLQRGIFGSHMTKLFDAYRFKTIAIGLLLAGALVLHQLSQRKIYSAKKSHLAGDIRPSEVGA